MYDLRFSLRCNQGFWFCGMLNLRRYVSSSRIFERKSIKYGSLKFEDEGETILSKRRKHLSQRHSVTFQKTFTDGSVA